MKKVISERQGVIKGFEVVNGRMNLTMNLKILTSVRSYETGELYDEEFIIPYTGDIATANKLLNEPYSGRVSITIETEFEEE